MKAGTEIYADPFSKQALGDLVHTDRRPKEVRVVSHEGAQKEFKESFSWAAVAEYARTMAAFANARGGYLIFGVSDNPRIAKGLSEASQKSFDGLDRAKLTSSLNQLFSPELNWDTSTMEISGVTLGLLYTYESANKPVMARKSAGRIIEGDILYRYNSRTERAKYPELVRIIDEARSREQHAMMKHLEELVRAGASNAAVLDFASSTLQGPNGERVLIDEELLRKIAFIKEGEFKEVQGAPALRLVGDVVPAKTISLNVSKVVSRAITTEDVIASFLDQIHESEPREYVKQAASGNTSFVPVHFYRTVAGMSQAELVAFVNSVNTRSPAKKKLLERLRLDDAMREPEPPTVQQYASTVARRRYFESLVGGELPTFPFEDVDDASYFLGAVRSLDDATIIALDAPLRRLIRECLDSYYGESGRLADQLRRASCRVDHALFGPHRAS